MAVLVLDDVACEELLARRRQQLELYALHSGRLKATGRSTPGVSALLTSSVLPLSFETRVHGDKNEIRVTRNDAAQSQWDI